jgi:CRP-like cAMP-binding protein
LKDFNVTQGRIETANTLIACLPAQEAIRLAPLLERVVLKQRDVLIEPFQPISHVHFFEGGLSSEIAINADNSRIEVGCIGREGLSGLPVVLGTKSTPHRSFVQSGGKALRIRADDLQQAMDDLPLLRQLLLRYAQVFMIQIAATALADGRYKVEQRLARWLLMSQDRLGDKLNLTHDFLALMLGVRRPSVTEALHVLEGEGMIKAARGLITIRSREKLEELAGGSYGVPESEYRRIISRD